VRGGNDWTTKVTADVFYYGMGITKIRFCIRIETIFAFLLLEQDELNWLANSIHPVLSFM
jgi:hypothetical protein